MLNTPVGSFTPFIENDKSGCSRLVTKARYQCLSFSINGVKEPTGVFKIASLRAGILPKGFLRTSDLYIVITLWESAVRKNPSGYRLSEFYCVVQYTIYSNDLPEALLHFL